MIRIDKNTTGVGTDDALYLWLDTIGPEPSAASADATLNGALLDDDFGPDSFRFSYDSNNAILIFDEPRVATTWNDVAIPEPGSLVLLSAGSLLMLSRRQK